MYFEATNPLAWIFRALFVMAVGVAGWGTAFQARRLLSEVLAKQRNERFNLQGERLEVAVLFADIRSVTTWSEKIVLRER